MLKVLGIIWLILGILWLNKPDVLKRYLQRKMTRNLRRIVFGFVIIFGFLLMGSIIKAEGVLLKIVGVLGALLVIKGIFLLTSKSSEKILGWWANKPLIFFRIWALFFIGIGAILILA